MEYVSLAKTRLADLKVRVWVKAQHHQYMVAYFSFILHFSLKISVFVFCLQESVEDMGLYEHVSGAGIASVQVTVAPNDLFMNNPC